MENHRKGKQFEKQPEIKKKISKFYRGTKQ